MRPNGNESVNFLMVHFTFSLNEEHKFYGFFPQIFVPLLSHRQVMGSDILHSSIGLGS